jgi:fused signal recognition particle receptor
MSDLWGNKTGEDEQTPEQPKTGWFQRLTEGLTRSSSKLGEGITTIFTKRRLDDAAIEELEELLLTADLGPALAARLTNDFARTRFGKEVEPDEVRGALAEGIAAVLAPYALPFAPDWTHKPCVVLMIGVNGAGKTTTLGKLAASFRAQGKSVMLAAGDTFRAAAVEQLQIWGQRAGVPVIAKETGADAAALAYEALERARRENIDLLLIDTAGRLHNKANLMDELGKIQRVLQKLDAQAPHEVLLVLDATTGQNAIAQVETFAEIVPVSGLIVTKLDGSAKGGIVVALAERCKLPLYAVGVGEGIDDLRPFDAQIFARALMGLEKIGGT